VKLNTLFWVVAFCGLAAVFVRAELRIKSLEQRQLDNTKSMAKMAADIVRQDSRAVDAILKVSLQVDGNTASVQLLEQQVRDLQLRAEKAEDAK
jgi:hypothetical protein